MIKIYVILFGLIGVAPAPDEKSATAILVQTQGHKTATGDPLVPHEALVKFRTVNGSVRHAFSGDLSFVPSGAPASFYMNLRDRERFPQLGRLLNQNVVTKPGCTGANPGTNCRLNNLPLVAARVRLSGGWTLRPIEVEGGDSCCDEPVLRPLARDRSIWGFRAANDPAREHGLDGELTNGFLFEIWLPGLASLNITGGGGLNLVANPEQDCKSLDPSAPNCAIIVVSNIGKCEVDCAALKDTAQEHDHDDDTHFEMLYALLNPMPAADRRFIPFPQTKHLPRPSQKNGPGQPPGSKCFGGLLQ